MMTVTEMRPNPSLAFLHGEPVATQLLRAGVTGEELAVLGEDAMIATIIAEHLKKLVARRKHFNGAEARREVLDMSIEAAHALDTRSRRLFERRKLVTIGDFAVLSGSELLNVPLVGPATFDTIDEIMGRYALEWPMHETLDEKSVRVAGLYGGAEFIPAIYLTHWMNPRNVDSQTIEFLNRFTHLGMLVEKSTTEYVAIRGSFQQDVHVREMTSALRRLGLSMRSS